MSQRVSRRPRSRREIAEARVDFRIEHLVEEPKTVEVLRQKMQLESREVYPEPGELRQAVALGVLAPGGAELVPADELLIVALCDQPHWAGGRPTWLLRTYSPTISRGRVQIGWKPNNRYRLDLPAHADRIVWRLANASSTIKSRTSGKVEFRDGACFPFGQEAAAEIWVGGKPEVAVPAPAIPRVKDCVRTKNPETGEDAEVQVGDTLVEFFQPTRVYRGRSEGRHPDCCPANSRTFALALELNDRLYGWCVHNADGWYEELAGRPGWVAPPEFADELTAEVLPAPVALVRDNPEDIVLHRKYRAPAWFQELTRQVMTQGYVVRTPIAGTVMAAGPTENPLVRQLGELAGTQMLHPPVSTSSVWISPTGHSADAIQIAFPGEVRTMSGTTVQAGDEIGFVRPPSDPDDYSSGAAQFLRLSLFEAQAVCWVPDGDVEYPVFPLDLVASLAGSMKMELLFDMRPCAPYAWDGAEGAYVLPIRGPVFLPDLSEMRFHLGSWEFDLQYPKKRQET